MTDFTYNGTIYSTDDLLPEDLTINPAHVDKFVVKDVIYQGRPRQLIYIKKTAAAALAAELGLSQAEGHD